MFCSLHRRQELTASTALDGDDNSNYRTAASAKDYAGHLPAKLLILMGELRGSALRAGGNRHVCRNLGSLFVATCRMHAVVSIKSVPVENSRSSPRSPYHFGTASDRLQSGRFPCSYCKVPSAHSRVQNDARHTEHHSYCDADSAAHDPR